MSSIVMSYPTEAGVCAEQSCTEAVTDNVLDTHWRRRFGLCHTHAEQFDGIQRRQEGRARCEFRVAAQDNGSRPPSPPDWCVSAQGHEGEHRMWSTARNG